MNKDSFNITKYLPCVTNVRIWKHLILGSQFSAVGCMQRGLLDLGASKFQFFDLGASKFQFFQEGCEGK